MHHAHRHDLPKGHTEAGEDDLACALRELGEETGLSPSDVELVPRFRYEERFQQAYRRFGGEVVDKTLVIFLARLVHDRELVLTEHIGSSWVEWSPPHAIQALTIDPLLERVAQHFARVGGVGVESAAAAGA